MNLDRQVKDALTNSVRVIEDLRAQVATLSVKANAFDTVAGLVGLLRPMGGGYASGPDAVYIIKRLLADIDAQELANLTPRAAQAEPPTVTDAEMEVMEEIEARELARIAD